MSKPLGIQDTFALLDRLRSTVREFLAKENAIRQSYQARSAAENKRCQLATQQRIAQRTAQETAAEETWQAARRAAETRFEKRQARIGQAFNVCHKRALDRIQQQQDRHQYTLQKRTLEAERQRETDLANASTRLAQVRSELTGSQERFAALDLAAKRAFSGIGAFGRLLSPTAAWPTADSAADEDQLLNELTQLHEGTEAALQRFQKNPLLGLFRVLPVWLLLSATVLGYAVALFALPYYGVQTLPGKAATAWLAASLALVGLAYAAAKRLGRPPATTIAHGLAKARQWHSVAWQKAEMRERRDREHIHKTWEETTSRLQEQWQSAQAEATQQRLVRPQLLEQKRESALAKNSELQHRALERWDRNYRQNVARLRDEFSAQEQEIAAGHQVRLKTIESEVEALAVKLSQEWEICIHPIYAKMEDLNRSANLLFPEWNDPSWHQWTPAATFADAARCGHVAVDLEALSEASFRQSRLVWPGPTRFALPLCLRFPDQGSLLLETGPVGAEEAIGAINAVLFRLLALAPAGKLSFTIFDPVGLGQNFAGLMHLADYDESQITSRIWTQSSQIEEKLGELSEHMEKVIQMYLRNEYATIAEYNAQAGTLAEKYHFLVIAGFPVNFSEAAGRRLLNIVSSGARCGVYTLIHWDQRRDLPHDFVPDELRKNANRLIPAKNGFVLANHTVPGTELHLDSPPSPQFATEFLSKVGQSAKDSSRVELPFTEIAPSDSDRWIGDSGDEFRVPIGRSGATKLQYFALGKATRQHALIAGKTGSGKSTLFHVLITSTALCYSPAQVELYLVDFKKGVEFKCYANRRLPHARVVAIESDREFGLSVLHRVDDELRRRGDLFRRAGVQDLPGYRRAEPTVPLPRLLLLIDEFQEFFTEEDRISQAAAVLLDRIVRQGRAFGLHVLLGSQTLGGAYTLARATIGQMVVRVALQCNEADAYLIMDENNGAPRLLSRPGEGIYNDMAGALEGNSPFQVAWLPDELRDRYLSEVRQRADQTGAQRSGPMIFEGNAPADLAENDALKSALQNPPTATPAVARVWLGAANAIKGPTEVLFQRQSGSNLLAVGQGQEALLGVPALALIALAAQYPAGSARFILIESSAPGTPERAFLDGAVQSVRHPVLRPKRNELTAVLDQLGKEILQRTGEEQPSDAPATFLIVANLQEHKLLRQEDDFSISAEANGGANPSAAFLNLITEGPSKGYHIIASVDTYGNATRALNRRLLGEFHWRVLFQMGASDSASLMDSQDASKLGFHRALLYNEREGYVEKFRPYVLTFGS